MRLTLLFLLLLATPLLAQDVRRAWYESTDSRRQEVTVVDPSLKPFYHGVASGDPLTDRCILWTRVTPEVTDTSVSVEWYVVTDTTARTIVRRGVTTATAARDFTVKVDADGLEPNTTYYYGFTAYGRRSLLGRFRTLTTTEADLRLAVVSCANYPAGYFNAYAALAERNDLNALLHLGDYIYEYSADSTSYAGATGKQLGREHEPSNEAVTLADYRTRYSQYRLDPDLRRLHQQVAFIHVWDDHESANDAWDGGAENHQPASEGDWYVRKAISKRVCMEWLPTREQPDSIIYRRFTWGDRADLFMLDTRQDGRSKQAQSTDSMMLSDHNIMSERQLTWLRDGLRTSTAQWKIIGNQVLFSPLQPLPLDTATLWSLLPPLYKPLFVSQLPTLENAMRVGFVNDNWNDYPRQRDALTSFLTTNAIKNVVFATGDFHTQFCVNNPWAVEFVGSSISAPNFDENFQSNALTRPFTSALLTTLSSTLTKNNTSLRAVDLVRHGYYILHVLQNSTQADYYFVDTLYVRTSAHHFDHGYAVARDASTLTVASTELPAGVADAPTPTQPSGDPVSVLDTRTLAPSPLIVMSVYPQPASSHQTLSYVVRDGEVVSIRLVDNAGRVLRTICTAEVQGGLHSLVVDVHTLPPGAYALVLSTAGSSTTVPLLVAR